MAWGPVMNEHPADQQISKMAAWLKTHAQPALEEDDPYAIATLLYAGLLGLTPQQFRQAKLLGQIQHNCSVDVIEIERALSLFQSHCPVPYILGWTYFDDLIIRVNQSVLIPRPDSEILVEATLQVLLNMKGTGKRIVWEPCVGSGALSIALMQQYLSSECPVPLHIFASDISADALSVAGENVMYHAYGDCITLFQANWLEASSHLDAVDLILMNPPYIPTQVISTLDKSVCQYEPHLALDGGMDGLDPYRICLEQAKRWLKSGGFFILEHGYDQKEALVHIIQDQGGWEVVSARQDLAGRDRVLVLQYRS